MASVEEPSGTWPVDTSFCKDWDQMSPAVTGRATTIAVNQLWRLTGRRFGLAPITIIPCADRSAAQTSTWQANGAVSPGPTARLSPYIGADGNWHNTYACFGCWTSNPASITLPVTPAQEVTDVTIPGSGYVFAAADFQILDHRTLQRVDGGSFPTTQDPVTPWTITYTWGVPVPLDGQYAAGILACEIAKSLLGLDCRLPRKLQSISRRGVTMQLVDSDYLSNGLTGIQEVDEFIVSVNPYGNRERSRVYSPDIATPSRQTWIGS